MSRPDRSDPYDVVIVGAGISGAILAKELAEAGASVLVLEAGTDQSRTFAGYREQVEEFRDAVYRTPPSPYPFNPNAPDPDVPDVPTPGSSYFVEAGEQPYRSTYTRTVGGSTLHWLGTCLRMLPEDFAIKSKYGRGRDWPLGYENLVEDYGRAEWEIGVSADVGEQAYLGVDFPPGYDYPMQPIPPSWLDRQIAAGLDGLSVDYGGVARPVKVRGTPAGRNSDPNPGYQPVGAVDLGPGWSDLEEGQELARDLGERCQGNSSCTPICPVQAKYNALKTLTKALKAKAGKVNVLTQAVASRVLAEGSRVEGIEYLRYDSPHSPRHTVEVARGRAYVLACHAVENAKLLLNSGAPDRSNLLGRCLYDHPVALAWGLMPEPIGSFRGPLCTSGIEDFRGGPFRSQIAPFRLEIGNEGWVWPMGAPASTAAAALENQVIGAELRRLVGNTVSRQFRMGMLIEELPNPANTVTIDPAYRDALGLPRPVITYGNLDDYTLSGLAAASELAYGLFDALGAENHTTTQNFIANATYKGREYPWDGAGHYAGTHLMGTSEENSVVDSQQRFWGYDNLHLAGPGSMPTMGTANPTLTVAALAFRTARDIRKTLEGRDGRA